MYPLDEIYFIFIIRTGSRTKPQHKKSGDRGQKRSGGGDGGSNAKKFKASGSKNSRERGSGSKGETFFFL